MRPERPLLRRLPPKACVCYLTAACPWQDGKAARDDPGTSSGSSGQDEGEDANEESTSGSRSAAEDDDDDDDGSGGDGSEGATSGSGAAWGLELWSVQKRAVLCGR
jgi:hypothetical protein